MALTVKGFQGTIGDADMATQLGGHHAPTVRSAADLLVTAVNGARTVNVAAGIADAAFSKVINDGAAAGNLPLAPPASGGKWYAITIDRQWSPANTVTLKADDLGVSDGNGTAPTSIPQAVITALAGLPNLPGTSGPTAGQRQILATVYVRAADTTLTLFDLRAVRTAAGNLSVPSLHALAALSFLFLDGASIVTRGHATSGPYQLRQATWLKVYGNWEPLAGSKLLLTGDAGTAASTVLAAKAASDIMLGYGNFYFPPGALAATPAGIAVRWNGGSWTLWEYSNIPSGELVDPANGTGFDTNGSIFEANVTGGLLTFNYNLYRSGGISANNTIATMKTGFRPAGRVQHTCTVYGNGTGPGTAYVLNDGSIGVDSWSNASSVAAARGFVTYRLAA